MVHVAETASSPRCLCVWCFTEKSLGGPFDMLAVLGKLVKICQIMQVFWISSEQTMTHFDSIMPSHSTARMISRWIYPSCFCFPKTAFSERIASGRSCRRSCRAPSKFFGSQGSRGSAWSFPKALCTVATQRWGRSVKIHLEKTKEETYCRSPRRL